jgi:hypothetical protein
MQSGPGLSGWPAVLTGDASGQRPLRDLCQAIVENQRDYLFRLKKTSTGSCFLAKQGRLIMFRLRKATAGSSGVR